MAYARHLIFLPLIRSLLAGALLLFLAPRANADEASVTGVGGTIQVLKAHPSVKMVSADVLVRVTDPGDKTSVSCSFTLQNLGRATTVEMGFPEEAKDREGFVSFASWVDGRPWKCRTTDWDGGGQCAHA